MVSFFAAALLMTAPTPRQGPCSRAFDAIATLAQSENNFGYAREVMVEGRGSFVRACRRHLTAEQVRCILRARSSEQLYACTP